jgi:lipopolysaccharide export system protein LptA
VLCAAALAPAAAALESDREQPLEVDANHFQTDQNKHVTVLTGAVRLTQGTIKGEADKGTVHQDAENQINRVVLEGRPAKLAQKLDGDGGMMTGRANTIDYTASGETAILTGDAVVTQENRGEFRGPRIVYNTKTGEVTGGSDDPNSRIHLRMLPTKTKAATDAVAPADKKK